MNAAVSTLRQAQGPFGGLRDFVWVRLRPASQNAPVRIVPGSDEMGGEGRPYIGLASLLASPYNFTQSSVENDGPQDTSVC